MTVHKLVASKFAVLLLLVAATPFCFAQTFPTVVATVKVTNQTTAIPSTVLFTPTADGLFRITIYMVTTVPKTNGTQADWSANVDWTDDAGNWLFVEVAVTPAYQKTNSNVFARTSDWPLTFWATAGTPISDSVQSGNGQAGGSTYEVFATLEQLM